MWSRGLRTLATVGIGLALAGCARPSSAPTTVGMIEVPAACPDLYERLVRIADDRTVVPGTGVDASRDRTAVDAWAGAESIDLGEVSRFARNVHADFPVVASGRLRTIGADVEVRADGPGVGVSLAALDRLVLTILTTDYADARVRALLDCYLDRIVGDGELEGRLLRLYVTSDPGVCFRGLVLAPRAGGACDAVGVTIPETRLPGPSPVALTWPATIAIAPGHLEGTSALPAEVRAALFLAHELVHFLDNEMGAPPRLASLGAYERRAYYVQEALGRLVLDGGVDLPLPLVWEAPRP